ncbi:protein-tyrosine phosphatase [Roseinatronobacter thiooxidans]|uniref:protein-tyrosine-phosphatase n=1 Tax=Roseinatronobacter thiooxidans TaxID=121821 RepID=A0A2W7PXX1_9RHOB|nr:low molecular weight protein-tyrosine-phosphatase [Roseinatronobacter thiooxidans]PZX41174.1 protein-tyrosine phosphatase [Roseinatronobacter thiooxidans]
MTQIKRVVFVCLGNICRSPTAHGIFRDKAAQAGLDVVIDSAGTGDWHIGSPPDRRATHAAHMRGYDLSDLRARQFTPADFNEFDLIFAMDRANQRDIEAQRPAGNTTPVQLFLNLTGQPGRDVPDPYFDGSFDQVLDMIEQGADMLVAQLQNGQG